MLRVMSCSSCQRAERGCDYYASSGFNTNFTEQTGKGERESNRKCETLGLRERQRPKRRKGIGTESSKRGEQRMGREVEAKTEKEWEEVSVRG